MSENGEIYTASKNFTLPPALTALTNFNSGDFLKNSHDGQSLFFLIKILTSISVISKKISEVLSPNFYQKHSSTNVTPRVANHWNCHACSTSRGMVIIIIIIIIFWTK